MSGSPLGRLREYLRTGLWQPSEISGFRVVVVRALRIAVMLAEGTARHRLPRSASALAFLSLLAAAPLAIVAASLLHWVGALGPVAYAAWPDGGEGFGGSLARALAGFTGTSMWPLALGLFLLIALAGLAMLERALNEMWGVRRPRGPFRRIVVYWLTGSAALVFWAVSMSAGALLHHPGLAEQAGGGWILSPALLMIVPLALALGVFPVIFLFLPNTPIRASAAVVGGACVGVAWEGLKHGGFVAAAGAGQADPLPGLMIFSLVITSWVLAAWVAVLVGGQLVYAVQHVGTHRRDVDLPTASVALKERVALRAVLEICRAFVQGREGPTIEALAAQLNAPLRLVSQVVYQLSSAGLVRELARSERRGTALVPARDPELVSVQNVIDAVRQYGSATAGIPPDAEGDELDEAVARARTRVEGALDKVNFKGIAQTKGTPKTARSSKAS